MGAALVGWLLVACFQAESPIGPRADVEPSAPKPVAPTRSAGQQEQPDLLRPRFCPTFRSGLDTQDWPEGLRGDATRAGTEVVQLTKPSAWVPATWRSFRLAAELDLQPLAWPRRIEYVPAQPRRSWSRLHCPDDDPR